MKSASSTMTYGSTVEDSSMTSASTSTASHQREEPIAEKKKRESEKTKKMAWRGNLSRNLKELRILLCQSSPSSFTTRTFVENNYKDLKKLNPKLPILIREASGIEPQLWARYDLGVERGVRLEGLTEQQISKALQDLVKGSRGRSIWWCRTASPINPPQFYILNLPDLSVSFTQQFPPSSHGSQSQSLNQINGIFFGLMDEGI
ncbi:hypothetical protein ACLB2K_022687 [Fragaria x ananassa]